jgi:hypothetical protein
MSQRAKSGVRAFPRRLCFDLRSADQVLFLGKPYTSVEDFFVHAARAFPNEAVWSHERRDLLDVLRLEGCQALEGHRLLYTEDEYSIYRCFRRKPAFATLLQDPVEWTLEAYTHARQDSAHPLYEMDLTIGDFLANPWTRNHVLNHQTRQLVGVTAKEWDELPDKALIDLARLRLDEFAFIGLASELDASLQLFTYTFSLPDLDEIEPTAPRHELHTGEERDADIVRRIRKTNHLDVELYPLAESMFRRRLEQMESELRHPPAWRYAVAAPPWYRRTVLRFGANLRRWKGIAALGRLRRRLVPEGSHLERTYIWLRRRLFGW